MAQGEPLGGTASAILRPARNRRAGFQMSALATAECLDEERRLGGHKVSFRGARRHFQRMATVPPASGGARAGNTGRNHQAVDRMDYAPNPDQ
jgi:hypothetical protein